MIEFALPFVYLLVAGLQIWHLKTFFEKKKAIICTYIVYWYPPYYKQKPNFFDPWSLVSSSSFGISCNGIHFGILGIENFNHKKNFTLALEGVPIFGLHNRTATYRFVTLVDFKMAMECFKSVEGGLLVDTSCGRGLFSRNFATYGSFSSVIALDFFENMLLQCYDFIKKDTTLLNK